MSTATAEKLVYTVEEVCQALGIGRSLGYQLVRERRIPALNLGRRVVIPRRALEQLLTEAGETKGQEPGPCRE